MLDTVKIALAPASFKVGIPNAWELKKGNRWDDSGQVSWKLCQHKESGLRVFESIGHNCSLTVEVSLPRLLYGSNGYLLRADDVNKAYFKALDIVSNVVGRVQVDKLNRVDLVHHFRGEAWEYTQALHGLGHKMVRRKQVAYFDSGLEWPGKNMHLRLYDKSAEMYKQPGMVQRLEAQLRGDKIDRVSLSDQGFDAANLYDYYRDICAGFRSRRLPRVGSVEALLVWMKQEQVLISGVDPVERYLAYKSTRTQRRIRQSLNSASLDYFDANFLQHLPEDLADLTYIDCPPRESPASETAQLAAAG